MAPVPVLERPPVVAGIELRERRGVIGVEEFLGGAGRDGRRVDLVAGVSEMPGEDP